MSDDLTTRLRVLYCALDDLTPCGTCLTCQAADEIERLRKAGDALSDLVTRRLPHHGWTTADRDAASALLDAWEEARRG